MGVNHKDLVTYSLYMKDDPEIKTSKAGNRYCKFFASRSAKTENGEHVTKYCTSFEVMVFEKNMDRFEDLNIHAGDCILVKGGFKTRTWKNEDGSYGNRNELMLNEIEMLQRKDEREQSYNKEPEGPSLDMQADDIPF